MLLVVLLLVLVAGGVLVGSVVANQPDWAWLAVLLCAVGAVLLVVARVRRRREASSSAREPATLGDGQPGRNGDVDSPESPARSQAEADSSGESATERVRQVDPEAEPDEEDTDVADSIVVSELDAEVVVLDERPRYHLTGCEWLGERQAIPLPVSEARGLGFTPCARCEPDAALAAGERASR